ncbi:MAG: hypothetical protein KKG33_12965 [candidate division Zixibacteria bacterium]|nr:hypothetical protein [candidate division Zixibacteria bacterium]
MPNESGTKSRSRKKKRPSDSEMLEEILEKIHERLREKDFEPKVADFLKVLEMKYKLKLSGDSKQKLLDLIEDVRREELEMLEDANGSEET